MHKSARQLLQRVGGACAPQNGHTSPSQSSSSPRATLSPRMDVPPPLGSNGSPVAAGVTVTPEPAAIELIA